MWIFANPVTYTGVSVCVCMHVYMLSVCVFDCVSACLKAIVKMSFSNTHMEYIAS